MDNNQDINTFIEKELHKIIATLSDNTLFERLKAEEQSINKTIESYKKTAELESKQKQNKILQEFSIKVDQVKSLIENLNNEKNFNLRGEFASQIENALQELISKIEYEQDNEIRLLNEKINIKVENLINSYKEKIKDLPQKRIGELNKIIETKTKQIKVLDEFYETASFDAELWQNTNKILETILEEEKRENEENQKKRIAKRETNYEVNLFPQVNYLLFEEERRMFNIFDKEISYKIPQVNSFFTQKSVSLIYNKHQRFLLKLNVEQLISRLLMSADAGNVLLYFIDSHGNGSLFHDYLNLPSELYSGKIFTQPTDIDKLLYTLQIVESDIIQHQLKSYKINDYNRKYPKSCIPYRVVIYDNFPKGFNSNATPFVEKLLRTGMDAGIHFIFTIDKEDFSDLNVQKILPLTNQITIIDNSNSKKADEFKSIKDNVIQISNKRFNKVKTLYFEDYFGDNFKWWSYKSSKLLSVPIGVIGKDEYNLTFEGENAHCVITGTTGSGKSCFIHSLITSACLNYSPNELRLFLIDLKSDVEFQSYALENLPHADFIALKSSPLYALHILSLIEEMIKERSSVFKQQGANARDLNDFKLKFPDKIMPRYLIIIDEYQQLLSDDYRTRALGHLKNIAEQGRGFGFNLVLASQTTALSSGTMENFGLKVLMKVRSLIAASELLGPNVDSDYKAKALLLKPGQAFIPDETKVGKVQSYFLVEEEHLKILKEIKNKWDAYEGDKYEQNLIVFNKEAPAYIVKNRVISKLKIREKKDTTPLLFSPGEKVMVDGNDFICQLKREQNNNVLVMGGNFDVSLRAANSVLFSLLPQLSREDTSINVFNYINKSNKSEYSSIKKSADIIKKHFIQTNYYERDVDISDVLKSVNDEVKNRLKELDTNNQFAIKVLTFFNIDNNKDFHEEERRTADSLVPKLMASEYTELLKSILNNGPKVGIHCIVHASNPTGYYNVFDYNSGDHSLFNHRVFGQVSDEESGQLIHNRCNEAAYVVDYELGEKGYNRVLYFDATTNKFDNLPVIKPYEFLTLEDLNKLLT